MRDPAKSPRVGDAGEIESTAADEKVGELKDPKSPQPSSGETKDEDEVGTTVREVGAGKRKEEPDDDVDGNSKSDSIRTATMSSDNQPRVPSSAADTVATEGELFDDVITNKGHVGAPGNDKDVVCW